MAKASAPGRTKTRLVPPLSYEEAAELNTAFLKDIAENLRLAGETAPIAPYMAFGPPGTEAFFEAHMPPGVRLVEAWRGDFGDCLHGAVQALLSRGHGAACVLNSDSPTLPTQLLIDLARALAAPGDRAVIGPAEDGGYYVLGLKAAHRRLFDEIDWSTERVFAQTLARAEEIQLPVQVLPSWYDVDDADGLSRLCRDLFEPLAADGLAPSAASHTRRRLLDLFGEGALQARLEAHRTASA